MAAGPARVIVEQDKDTGQVTYREYSQRRQVLRSFEVLHVLGMTLDGLKGVSPVTFARESREPLPS